MQNKIIDLKNHKEWMQSEIDRLVNENNELELKIGQQERIEEGYMSEISELKEMNRGLRSKVIDLKKSLKEISDMKDGIIHDLEKELENNDNQIRVIKHE